MNSTKDIKSHIKSVQDTRKITNAMYLIASTKLQKAKAELNRTRPYFTALKEEIKRIFRLNNKLDSKYFYPLTGEHDFDGAYGYLVITADKGLAGAYNSNVIKTAMNLIKRHDEYKLYVVGEYGRQYFQAHNMEIEQNFMYTAQNPTIKRAREIAGTLVEDFKKDKVKKIFVIYTDISQGMEYEVNIDRILPLHRRHFLSPEEERQPSFEFKFEPSVEAVLNHVIPSYVVGFIYSALIASFSSEQNARMVAMDSANTNAEKLVDELQLKYNHIRQSDITREITEITSGAKSLKRLSEHKEI